MRWKVTKSKCAGGDVAWIVKDPRTSWEYVPFRSERQALDYALELNAEEERREALAATDPAPAEEVEWFEDDEAAVEEPATA
jgi:hypothetical protein